MIRKLIATLCALTAVVAVAGCTPAQLTAWQTHTGVTLTAEQQAPLLDLPDAPYVMGHQTIQVDGTITDTPEDMLSARERFELAVSRTSWATRPDLHRRLWCIIGIETGRTYFQRAFNGRGNDLSYGWLQINMKGSLGPARMAQFGLSSYEDLFIPEVNLAAGWELFQAARWQPWSNRC